MRALAAVWDFVSGGSRFGPPGAVVALGAAALAAHAGVPVWVPQALLVAGVAATVAAASYER